MGLIYKVLFVIVFANSFSYTLAQPGIVHPLSIGDTISNIPLGTIAYETGTEKNVYDFKGKLVIIDFWDVWCKSCIESMPKLESLQNKFRNKVQIILVTQNNKAAITKLFDRSSVKQPKLLSIVSDTIFSKLFPHTLFPHSVWIDKNSIVRQVTAGYNTNEANIRAAVAGTKLELSKKTELQNFDRKASLLKEGNGRLLNHVASYSLILNWINEFGGSNYGEKIDTLTKTIGLSIVNMPLLFLYKTAFSNSVYDIEFDDDNTVILNVTHPDNFNYPKNDSLLDSWISHNLFSYESSIPVYNKEELYAKMQSDLMSFFPYKAQVEQRKVNCLVLIKNRKKDIKSAGGPHKIIKKDNLFVQKNLPVGSLIAEIINANPAFKMPLIDGTEYSYNIDIKINANLNNIPKVKKELRRYGLDLIEQEKEMKILVISEKGAVSN